MTARRIVFVSLWILLSLPQTVLASVELGPHKRWTGLATLRSPEIGELKGAVERFERGDYEGCLSLLDAACAKHVHLPPARLMLARMFLGSGQTAPGRAELERVAAGHPESPDVHLTLGELALMEGRLSDAEVQFRRAASLGVPEVWSDAQTRHFRTACLSGLAEVAERRGQWERARQILDKALTQSTDDAALHQRMGRIEFELGDLDACRRHLDKAVSRDATLPPVPTLLGLLHARRSQFEQAEQLLRQAARSHPENAKAQLAYASWLLTRERNEEAWEAAQAALAADPRSREARYLCGTIQRFLGRPAEAERYFEALVAETPEDRPALLQLALVLAEQDDPPKRQRAADLALAVFQQDPTSRETLATLGWCYYHLDRLDEAERVLQTALLGGEGPAAAAYYLAEVFDARGSPERARPLLEAALKTTHPFAYREAAKSRLAELSP